MRPLRLLSLLLMVGGLAILAWYLPREGGEFYLVVIIPVLVLRGPLSVAGAALLLFGLFLGFFTFLEGLPTRLLKPPETPRGTPPPAGMDGPGGERESRARRRFGGIVLLGPIPIIFGSDVRVTTLILILALALTVVLVVLYL